VPRITLASLLLKGGRFVSAIITDRQLVSLAQEFTLFPEGFVETYLLICAFALAVIGSVKDVVSRRIPNQLTYLGFAAALIVRTFMLGWPGLKEGLIGTLAGGGIFFFLFLLGGMGGGDVKLMAAVSAWAGSAEVVNLLAAAAFGGGAMAVAVMLYQRRTLTTIQNTLALVQHHLTAGLRPHPELNVRQTNSVRVPFAPAIAVGTLYCLSRTFSWG
jgi:prepilin peptidase CpaA